MCRSAWFVKGTRESQLTQQVYYSLSLFQRGNGRVCPWTSSLTLQLHRGVIVSIYVVGDRLTNFTHFFTITSMSSALQIAELFFREVFKLHGLPKTIVSDRDNRFMGTFWQEFFRLVGTKLTPSTSYHPQADGQTEIVNKWLEAHLCNYVIGQQWTWVKWLHLGEYYYNTTYHMLIGMSPFRALYGYDALSFSDMIFGYIRAPGARDWILQS